MQMNRVYKANAINEREKMCIAYHDGICLRAQEVLERMVQNGDK